MCVWASMVVPELVGQVTKVSGMGRMMASLLMAGACLVPCRAQKVSVIVTLMWLWVGMNG